MALTEIITSGGAAGSVTGGESSPSPPSHEYASSVISEGSFLFCCFKSKSKAKMIDRKENGLTS
jgi:hypothetical protein